MKLVLSTWLVADQKGQETLFPQNKGASSSWAFQEVYWKCIVVFFFTARRFHPEAKLVLFLNCAPCDESSSYVLAIKSYGVEVVITLFATRPPEGFTDRFGNQFYVFDVIDYIAARPAGEGWYVLDSDCVFSGRYDLLDVLVSAPRGILCFDCNIAEAENINGISRIQLTQIAKEEGWLKGGGVIDYSGGEFFAATSSVLSSSIGCFRSVREQCVDRWRNKKLTVTEEAHVLSLIYTEMGLVSGSANHIIKRMWTAFKYNNIMEEDLALPVWHLPSEKRTGLACLYGDILKYGKRSKDDRWWRRRLAEQCGIPRRGLWKLAGDVNYKLSERLLSIIK
jgi:hypothetical protein